MSKYWTAFFLESKSLIMVSRALAPNEAELHANLSLARVTDRHLETYIRFLG